MEVIDFTEIVAIPDEDLIGTICRLRHQADILEQALTDGFRFDERKDRAFCFSTEDVGVAEKHPFADPVNETECIPSIYRRPETIETESALKYFNAEPNRRIR